VRLYYALALVSAAFVGPSPDWNSGYPNAVGRCSTPSTSRRRRRSCGRDCRTRWVALFLSHIRHSLSLSPRPRPSPFPGPRRCCRRCHLRHCSSRRTRSRFTSCRKPQVSSPRFLPPTSFFSSLLFSHHPSFLLFSANCFLLCCAILISSLIFASVSSCLIAAFNRLVPAPSSSTYVITLLSRKPWTAIINAVHVMEPPHIHTLHQILHPRIPLISVVDQNCCMYVKSLTSTNEKISQKRLAYGQ
jgi:hypothetical protein